MTETPHHRRSIGVPTAQTPAVLDALVATYAARADALAAAARAGPVAGARRDLAEVEDLLDAVVWRAAPTLSGPAGLVREVLYAALLHAVEACGERCREYEAGRAGRADLAAAVADLEVLHALFASVEEREAL